MSQLFSYEVKFVFLKWLFSLSLQCWRSVVCARGSFLPTS